MKIDNKITLLKNKLKYWNELYRKGTPVVSDEVYDKALEELENLITPKEFNEFRKSLMDNESGKKTFPFIAGSLEKIKPETFNKIPKNNEYIVSVKLDGSSVILEYYRGELVGAYTRGNGFSGETIPLEKLPNVPRGGSELLNLFEFTGFIRGEVVISKDKWETIKEHGYTSLRNAVAGILNEKEINPEKCQWLDFVAYEYYEKNKVMCNFVFLDSLGFKVPYFTVIRENLDVEKLKKLLAEKKENYEYQIDGLVICLSQEKVYKDKITPENAFAFKVNEEGIETKVLEIEWNMSKDGNYIPLAHIEPIVIGDAIVSKVSCHNYKYVIENKLGTGAIIKVVRSGDIIPYITEVLSEGNMEIPKTCEYCGTELVEEGVHLKCPNDECKRKEFLAMVDWLRKCGVKGFNEKAIENMGIDSFEKLVKASLTNLPKGKNSVKFTLELNNMFNKYTLEELFINMNWGGLNRNILRDLLKQYKLPELKEKIEKRELNVSDASWERLLKHYKRNFKWIELILMSEYAKTLKKREFFKKLEENEKETKGTICFTGVLSIKRKEAEQLASKCGFKPVSSVSKNLDILVVGEKAGSKLSKAEKYGVKIITADDFMKAVNENKLFELLNK